MRLYLDDIDAILSILREVGPDAAAETTEFRGIKSRAELAKAAPGPTEVVSLKSSRDGQAALKVEFVQRKRLFRL